MQRLHRVHRDRGRPQRHQHLARPDVLAGSHREAAAVGQRHVLAVLVEPAPVEVQPDQSRDVLGAGPAGHLGRRPVLDDLALLDDEQPVGHHHRLERVVRDEQARAGELGQVPGQLGAHLEPRLRVQRRERLVEQQQRGVGGERPGQRDPLGLAAGEPAGTAPGEAADAEPVEVRLGVPSRLGAAPAAGPGREGDVVDDAQVREEPVGLEDQPDRPLLGRHEAAGAGVVEDGVAEPYPAVGDRRQPGQDPQQGGLAGPVGAEHAEHLPRLDHGGDIEPERVALDGDVDVERPRGGSQHPGHADGPVRSHRSRRATRTTTDTASSTSDSAIAASGSVSRAR